MFVCPFPTEPKYWKIKGQPFFLLLLLFFSIRPVARIDLGGCGTPKKGLFWTSPPLPSYKKHHFWPILWPKVELLADLGGASHPRTPLATGLFSILHFQTKMLKQNVRIYSNCPKKALWPDLWFTTPSNTRIKPILGLCMPKNAHMNGRPIAFLVCPDFKKKRSIYQPSQFSGQKGRQTFYFFRPNKKGNDTYQVLKNVK